jgi:hypothetical protein
LSHLPDRAQRRLVEMAVRRDYSAIMGKRTTGGKVKRFPVQVTDPSASLLHDQGSRGLIPDLFAVIGLFRGEQAEKEVSGSSR